MAAKIRGLENKAAVIVTGASSGIGRALALALAEKYGARLLLNARNQEVLQETAKLVEAAGGQTYCVVGDVADEKVRSQIVNSCLEHFGGVDLLVNNAGLAVSGAVTALTPADWRYVFEVNFFAALNLTYAVLPTFLQQ